MFFILLCNFFLFLDFFQGLFVYFKLIDFNNKFAIGVGGLQIL